jgi:hypothetical protein
MACSGPDDWDPVDREKTAYHEAGHASSSGRGQPSRLSPRFPWRTDRVRRGKSPARQAGGSGRYSYSGRADKQEADLGRGQSPARRHQGGPEHYDARFRSRQFES